MLLRSDPSMGPIEARRKALADYRDEGQIRTFGPQVSAALTHTAIFVTTTALTPVTNTVTNACARDQTQADEIVPSWEEGIAKWQTDRDMKGHASVVRRQNGKVLGTIETMQGMLGSEEKPGCLRKGAYRESNTNTS